MTIERLLEQKTGLSAETLGRGAVEKAMHRRMAACGIRDAVRYLTHIRHAPPEWEALTELVVVPETWFFRNRASFVFLKSYVMNDWLPAHDSGRLRILSLPCSTGEEPYSVAMTLLEAGLPRTRFHIDAADISGRALERAGRGEYTRGAFRGNGYPFLKPYFQKTGGIYRLRQDVRTAVRFSKSNLMAPDLLAREPVYDILFCRNLMIYLSPSALRRAMRTIERLLIPDGMLFVGHAEHEPFRAAGYIWSPHPGAFALRRPAPSRPRPYTAPAGKRAGQICESAYRFTPRPGNPHPANRGSIPDRPDLPADGDMLETARRLADQGMLEEAMRCCQACLCLRPSHAGAHFLAGMICRALGDEVQAETCLDRTVYLDPNHHEALIQLALIAEHRGNRVRAAQLRSRAERVRRREKRT
ncbi:CheR family methyltransferase [Desulfonema ishimotonii]|uniref:CheR family methyltransferase n=1 Tax=Desulfonema ishimotonii TaxID=45657 RepID=UPI001407710C|nr:protein-glutamate O-methyltransferase CheR [Desulfonema ishimotonii]